MPLRDSYITSLILTVMMVPGLIPNAASPFAGETQWRENDGISAGIEFNEPPYSSDPDYQQRPGVPDIEAVSTEALLTTVILVMIPLLTLLAGLAIWSWSLRRQVTRRAAQLAAEIIERRQFEDALQHRSDFDKIITDISMRFMKLTHGLIDDEINYALESVGKFTGADRSFIFLISEDGSGVSNTHEWCAQGIEPQKETLRSLSVDDFPWWMEKVGRFELIHAPRIADLPPDAISEKALLRAEDVRSVIAVPMVSGGSSIGFLGFDSVNDEKTWVDIDIAMIWTMAESITNAIERKRAEDGLYKSEEFQRVLIETSPDFIYVLDDGGTILRVNRVNPDGRRENVVGKKAFELRLFENQSNFETIFRHAMETGRMQRMETRLDLPDGRHYYLSRLNPISFRDEEGSIVLIITDITEQKKTEEALRESEESLATEKRRLADILEGTNVGSWEWNIQTGETIFNERWANTIGYTLEELSPVSIDTWRQFCHPDDLVMSNELLERHFTGQSDYYMCETRLRHKNGDWVWVLDRGKVSAWSEDGRPLIMSGTQQDVTERINARTELEQYAETQEVLLKEINHRVKNNLTALMSIVNQELQIAGNDGNTDVHPPLVKLASRVRGLAAVHSLLSSSGWRPLRLDLLCNTVISTTLEILRVSGGIRTDVMSSGFRVDSNIAHQLTLVLNELVTNSTKHAFRDGMSGHIKLSFDTDEGSVTIIYKDDGPGFPENVLTCDPSHLSVGHELIHGIIQHTLGGTIELANRNGALVKMNIPVPHTERKEKHEIHARQTADSR